jgi:di/tricarboxylate transporter/CRP-like cAMP-binding protein
MSGYEAAVLNPILDDPILSRGSYTALARLLPHVAERLFSHGEKIFTEGDPADYLYLIRKGKVALDSAEPTHVVVRDGEGNLVTVDGRQRGLGPKKVTLNDGHFGEEAGTDAPEYLCDATAASALSVLMIPRAKLANVIAESPVLRAEFYTSLMDRFGGHSVRRKKGAAAAAARAGGGWMQVWGWLAAIVAPALLLAFGSQLGFDRGATAFLAILSATIMMWAFNLMDEYVPVLFALLSTLILGLVPASVALSGFASEGFFMAMSILGLGALIVASGLSYRFLLMLLRYLPNRPFWHHAGLVFTGFLLTPVVPSMNARIALVGPFMTDMADILRLKPRGGGATEMAVAAFAGATLLSPVFLTSKSVNFVVFGLLPAQAQEEFSWLAWALGGAAYAVAMLVIYIALVMLTFRGKTLPVLSKDQVAVQLKLLGGLKRRELAAIVGIVFFTIGVITSSFHRIPTSWLGLAILYGLLLFGFLRKDEFKEKIDWTLLVYLGGLGGITAVFESLGLGKWLAAYLSFLGDYMRSDFAEFVLVFLGIMFLVRLVLPINATIVICAAILMPLATISGVHPWAIGFVVLAFGELWFLPFQCSYYTQFRDAAAKSTAYDEKTFLRLNALLNVLKLAAVLASISYWEHLGLV